MNALSISRDLEQSIIEKEFYNYFAGKDSETRILINSIKEDTLDHQSMVRNAWEEERKIALNLPRKP
jgi:ferritin-like protein